jgi:hypothetical protein
MKLQTPVTDLKCRVGISYSSKITMLGSCFSDNIGSMLADYGFDVLVNPFGTLYNPISIKQSIRTLLSDKLFTEEDCVMMGAGADLICSFSHHTSFARRSREEFLENANRQLQEARRHFLDSDKVIITLGTSWCYTYMSSGKVVSNCLKRPATEFIRERLDIETIKNAILDIMEQCDKTSDCKKKEFIFTVSPIRHFRDGAHGNQISKAALLVAIDEVINTISNPEKATGSIISGNQETAAVNIRADYFPAYEIMMDELRDYRFYAEDMCHPSQQAVDYIGERFLGWALAPEDEPTLQENIRRFKRSRHLEKFTR